MKKLLLLLVLVLVSVSVVLANTASEGEGYNIKVSPNTLKLASKVDVLTVHSDIPFTLVDTDTIVLNGMTPILVKADDLGALVTKFDISELKGTLDKGTLSLTLSAVVEGELVQASDTIAVK